MIILIPAYEPDQHLPALIRSLRAAEPRAAVVVVDDGSGPAFKDVFDDVRALGCHVIGYARNRGKGFALKTAFGFIADNLPGHDVVCADSDGQHPAADILRVAAAVQDNTMPDSSTGHRHPAALQPCHRRAHPGYPDRPARLSRGDAAVVAVRPR